MILVPFLPIFSRLTEPKDWPELKDRIRQALILSALTMLPLSALMLKAAREVAAELERPAKKKTPGTHS